ncbi:hypothetical protein BX260_0102 [Streptomyces sp. 5112.2]|nr:hypothetical protein BX260_0102 [Streptomyces sp. 5112.2]
MKFVPKCANVGEVRVGRRSVVPVALWLLALAVLLPVMVLQERDAPVTTALVLQGVVVMHAGIALTRVLTATSVRLVALGFWVFTYIWFGLTPLAMLATDAYPWGYRAGEETSLTAVAVVELGLLAHGAGTLFAAHRERARTVHTDAHSGRTALASSGMTERLLSRRLAPWRLITVCVLVLALATVLLPGQPGGLMAYFTSRQALGEARGPSGSDGAALSSLRSWSLCVPAFWALLGVLHVPRPAGGGHLLRRIRSLLLPLLVALSVVVNNPISKPRFWAGTVLLTLLFTIPRLNRPRAFRMIGATLVTTVLIVFPYSDYFRYSDREQMTAVASLATQFTTNGDYDAFQQVQTGIDYARDEGFSPRRALGPVLFLVPRSVWPDKPADTGMMLAQYAHCDLLNLSAPLWIESYLWAGPAAVTAVFFLLGAAGRRMDDVRHRLRDRAGTLAVLLVPAFAFYQIIFLRGSLLGIVGPLTLLVTIPLLITVPAARTARLPSPAMPPAPIPLASTPGTGGHS